MDYLYINGVVNETYKDMPCGCPFPEVYRKMLHATVAAQDWKNPGIPRVLSSFTLRTNGEQPVIVLSSVQRHETTASVARLIQCDGWQWQPELLRGQLDQVLHAGFYTEEEVIEQGKRFALPKDRNVSYDAVPIRMSAKVKEAVLTTVFLRWMRYDPALCIAVPKGVDYNSYVISAVKAIYGLFPLGLRARAGFCSFMPEYEQAGETVSIGFVPEEMADSRTLFLDGSSSAVCQSLCCGTNNKGLDTLIQYLAQSSDADRTAFLDELFRELEGNGESEQLLKIKPNDYGTVGVGLNLLALNGSLRELMPQWKKEFLDTPEKFTPTMRRRIRKKICDTIDPAQFCAMAEESWKRGESDVFTSLKAYEPYCQENQPLKDALWEAMLKHMTARKSFGEVHQLVTKRERDLNFLLDGEKKDWLFCKAKNEAFQTLLKEPAEELKQIEARKAETLALRAEVAKSPASRNTKDLLDRMDSYILSLDKQYNDLRCRQLAERYQKIRSMPNKTVQQLTQQLKDAKDVLQQLEQLPQTPERDTLCRNLQQFTGQIETFIHSSGAKFARIREILTSNQGYFPVLEELNRADKTQLEETDRQTIAQLLEQKRPRSLELYEQEFTGFYHKPMILANIAKLPDYICGWVVRDICQLDRIQLHCSVNNRADATAQQIDGALYMAGKISEGHKVFAAVDSGKNLDARWLRKMVRLGHDARSMGEPEDFKEIFRALALGGAFTGDDMIPAVEMYRRCGLKFMPLFKLMIQGCFRDATEAQYRAAYKLIVDYSDADKAKVLDGMKDRLDRESGKDKVAGRAFQDVLKSQSGGKKGGKAWMIASIALGVVTVALGAAVVVLALKPAPQMGKPAQTTLSTTAPTEPEVVIPQIPEEYAYAMKNAQTLDMLYNQSFEEHWAVVEKVLEDYSTGAIEKFDEKKGTMQSINNGMEVSWEEYMFWACRTSITENAPAAEDSADEAASGDNGMLDTAGLTGALNNPSAETVKILQVIHRDLPSQESEQLAAEPEETATEATTEQTEPMTEPAGETMAESEGQTDPTGETVQNETVSAETEPAVSEPEETVPEETTPSTLEEVKAAVYAAAKDAYVSSVEPNRAYRMLLRLLGTNYDLNFETLSAGVEQWLRDAESADLQKHYAALPGTAMVSPEGTDAVVTWNEYVFWECWYLKNYRSGVIGADSFDAELQRNVAQILNVVHCLGGENVPRRSAEEPAEAEVDLYQTIVAYARAAYETARQDCRTAYALEETPDGAVG